MNPIRAAVGAFAVVFALLLTACGGDDKPKLSPTPPATVTATQTPSPDFTKSSTPTPDRTTEAPTDTASLDATEQAFADIVSSEVEALADYSDEEIVYLGGLVCKDFDSNLTVDQVLTDVYNIPGIDGYDVGFFTGLSVQAFCPQYQPLLDQFLATAVPTS